jgi:hypothetical protein
MFYCCEVKDIYSKPLERGLDSRQNKYFIRLRINLNTLDQVYYYIDSNTINLFSLFISGIHIISTLVSYITRLKGGY